MKKKNFREIADFYAERFAYQKPMLKTEPAPGTRLILVIPCYDEEYLLTTWESLLACDQAQHPVEIITVINSGVNASLSVLERNQKTIEEVKKWKKTPPDSKLSFQLLNVTDLPKKYAGVGLARKIGMDEALARFAKLDFNGGIVCLDADCEVKSNYLQVLEEAFEEQIYSAAIYFEHRQDVDPILQEGILQYELFLRYYVQALKFCAFPHAFHTVGSSMAVRAEIYALSGGMNRRKAGEDFYFMHKVAALGKHENIIKTTVYPSARVSHRVPFGTGKAQGKWLEKDNKVLLTYPPAIFKDVKEWISLVPEIFEADVARESQIFNKFPEGLKSYFQKEEFLALLREIKKKSPTYTIFYKHFFHKIDGLQILKMVHHLKDQVYGEIPIIRAASELLEILNISCNSKILVGVLLAKYRELDRTISL